MLTEIPVAGSISGKFDPPPVTLRAFDESDFLVDFFEGYPVCEVLVGLAERKILFALPYSFEKIPHGLCDELGCLSLWVELGIVFVKADATEFVAESGVHDDLAELFAVESVGTGIGVSGCVALAYSGDVNSEQIGVAHYGFGVLYVALYLSEPIGVEVHFLHQGYVVYSGEVGLVGEIAEVEEIVGLFKDDLPEIGVAVGGLFGHS